MPREVNDTQPFTDKLVKLIPTEIVAAYLVLAGMLGFNPADSNITALKLNMTLIQVVFFILLVLTPLYLWKAAGVTNKIQLIVTTASYVVWVYSLGGPFVVWNIFNATIASVVLVLWSLIIPLTVRPQKV